MFFKKLISGFFISPTGQISRYVGEYVKTAVVGVEALANFPNLFLLFYSFFANIFFLNLYFVLQ